MKSKCRVKISKDETKEAILYGIFQHSHIKQEFLRGEIGGVIAYPVAVVDWGEGLIDVPVSTISDVKEDSPIVQVSAPIQQPIQVQLDGSNIAGIIGESLINPIN